MPEAPTLKSASILLSILVFLPATAFAADLRQEAKKAFDRCMVKTKKAREQCSFGGCGNIVGDCYDRQLGTVTAAIEPLTKRLGSGRCAPSASSAATQIDTLDARLKSLPPLDGTWSGYEVMVEVALLKYKVMSAMAEDCGRDG